MAKGRKAGRAGKQTKAQKPREAAKPRDVKKMIPASELVALVRRLESCKQDASEASGRAGEMVKHAVETKGVDRVGLQMARRLFAIKDGNKLATTLGFLDYALDVLGITERAEKQAKMFDEEESGAKVPGAKKKQSFEPFEPLGKAASNVTDFSRRDEDADEQTEDEREAAHG